LYTIGQRLYSFCKHEEAIAYYGKALRTEEELNNVAAVAMILSDLGCAHYSLGNFEEAIKCNERALKIYDELNEERYATSKDFTIHCLGKARGSLRAFKKNQSLYGQALIRLEEANRSLVKAYNLSVANSKLGRFKTNYYEFNKKIRLFI
jgi:tetratricopeptide (TPR) repeat protein